MCEPYILIVEDSMPVINMYLNFLDKRGINYMLAESIARAKEILQTNPLPKVIIMDGCVKDGETPDLVEYIRTSRKYEGLIIAATSDMDDTLADDLLDVGCNEHWNKYSALCRAVEVMEGSP